MSLRWKIAQWFELRWWKNYLSSKDKEKYLIWKKNYWKEILLKVAEIVELDSSKSICDFGCGPAGSFIAISQNKITAIDPLIYEYEKRTSFFRNSDYPNTTFVRSTIEDFVPESQTCQVSSRNLRTWQVSPHKYDLVFCMNAINHIQHIELGFDKMKEVCADGGSIIITVDAHNFKLLKYLFHLIPWDILHPHQYTLKEYQFFLEKNGWHIVKSKLLKKGLLFDHYLLAANKSGSIFSDTMVHPN